MSIDWKKVAKNKRADHLFLAKMMRENLALMRKMTVALTNRDNHVRELKKQVGELEEKLWKFQMTNNLDEVRKMTLKTKPGKGYNINEICKADLAAILGVHRNTVVRFVVRGFSVSDMVDWAIERDRMFLVRRHANGFNNVDMRSGEPLNKKPRLNMQEILE